MTGRLDEMIGWLERRNGGPSHGEGIGLEKEDEGVENLVFDEGVARRAKESMSWPEILPCSTNQQQLLDLLQ